MVGFNQHHPGSKFFQDLGFRKKPERGCRKPITWGLASVDPALWFHQDHLYQGPLAKMTAFRPSGHTAWSLPGAPAGAGLDALIQGGSYLT